MEQSRKLPLSVGRRPLAQDQRPGAGAWSALVLMSWRCVFVVMFKVQCELFPHLQFRVFSLILDVLSFVGLPEIASWPRETSCGLDDKGGHSWPLLASCQCGQAVCAEYGETLPIILAMGGGE